jgi:hypothetical protein
VDEVTVRVFSSIILLITLVVVALPTRRKYWLRKIRAYDVIPSLIGQSIESSQPIHISLGSAGIGGSTTLAALAGAEFAFYVSEQATIGDAPPVITLSDPSAIPLGQDALRRAYYAHNRGQMFRPTRVQWYPSGTRSMAFAAALTRLMATDRVSTNVLTGSYGPELALLLYTSKRRGITSIAVSDQLEGQAIAFALADHRLIGEEAFVAPSYLSDDPGAMRRAVAIDVMRWLLVLAIVIGFGLKLVEKG